MSHTSPSFQVMVADDLMQKNELSVTGIGGTKTVPSTATNVRQPTPNLRTLRL